MTELIAATSAPTLAEDRLIGSLIGTLAFRNWCGESTADAARNHCHHDELPPPANNAETYSEEELDQYRPYALVWTHDGQDGVPGFEMQVDSKDTSHRWVYRGAVILELVQEVPAEYANDERAANRAFKNSVGEILEAIGGLAGQGNADYLAFTYARWERFGRLPDELKLTDADCLHAIISLHWGTD